MTFIASLLLCLSVAQDDGVLPKADDGRTLNFDFETGDLRDWKVEGKAFEGQPVEGDVVSARRTDMKSRHQGKFWIGGWERAGDAPTGTLTSVPFTVTHTFASFLIGGGPHNTTVVQLVRADTGREVFQASGGEEEDMHRVLVDLFSHRGKQIFIRIIDKHKGHWGHVNFDDFRFHDKRPNFPERKAPKVDQFLHAGLDPEAAARAMTVPEGFEVKLFAGEPDIKQPIGFCIDDRGRLWVAENYTYPNRSTQPMYLRNGQKPTFKGKDRILIFEDTDGDGHFDKRTVFMEGFEHITGIEYGFGGIFVGAAPYLLHVPDKNGDDKPDGEPVVLLDGWGAEDTHETLNSFKWGPDGWLYGCHGVFTFSTVGKPGTPRKDRTKINAGIWRYHPTKKNFEVFAEGTSNPWGVDFNEHGDAFLVCCVIPHLFHVFPGGRFDRQAGSHHNPFTYDDIQTIAKHRHWVGSTPHSGNGRSDEAGGGHAHSGCMVYQGGTWPKEYHGKIFMNNIHGARINVDVVTPKGSGYEGDRYPDFLKANDSWSQILNLQYGPDGNVYMIDWYDANQCHRIQPEVHDPRNGRIFKVVWKGAKNTSKTDLASFTDVQLIDEIWNENAWYRTHAKRILMERLLSKQADEVAGFAQPLLQQFLGKVQKAGDVKNIPSYVFVELSNLRSATLAFHPKYRNEAKQSLLSLPLDSSPTIPELGGIRARLIPEETDPVHLRVRAHQLLVETEAGMMDEKYYAEVLGNARLSPSPTVRLSIASIAQQLSYPLRTTLLQALLSHAEDASDHNLPMMYWYAAEPLAAVDPAKALDLALNGKIPRIWEFMARRIAAIDSPEASSVLAAGLTKFTEPEKQKAVLKGMNFTFQGRRNLKTPTGWAEAAAGLLKSRDAETRSLAMSLSAKFGDASAMGMLRQIVVDKNVGIDERKSALATLVGARDKELPPTLYALIFDAAMRKLAIQALGAFSDSKTPEILVAAYPNLPADEKKDVLIALASREAFAMALMDAVAAKKIAGTDVSADVIRQLRNLQSKTLDQKIADVWGVARETSADKAKQIAKIKAIVTRGYSQAPDLSLGRAMFKKHCGNCHTLFDDGAKTAPELTGSNRRDLEYVLSNVVDPNALIGKDYLAHRIVMNDGRVLTAIIKSQTDKTMTIVTATETITISKSDVETTKESKESLMPEKLLEPLSEHELRSLIRYLASPNQVPLPAGFKMDEKKK